MSVFRTKIDEINQRREEEVKAANLRLQKLQSDLTAANQVRAQTVTSSVTLSTLPLATSG